MEYGFVNSLKKTYLNILIRHDLAEIIGVIQDLCDVL